MTQDCISELKAALAIYRSAVEDASEVDGRADFERLIAISERLVEGLEGGKVDEIKMLTLAFSRCVTDSFAKQPAAYRDLSKVIQSLK